MISSIRTFVHWNRARRREALAARWDETADSLTAKRVKAASAAGEFTRVQGANDPQTRGLWQLVGQYAEAERNARIIAEQIRAGR